MHTYSSFGEVSFLCNVAQTSMVLAREFCKVLWLDKKSFTDILKIYFLDGRIILNNLLEVCLLRIFFQIKISPLSCFLLTITSVIKKYHLLGLSMPMIYHKN